MDTREQTYSAIIKLLSSLDDPFTRFLPPDRLAALRRGTAGERPWGDMQDFISAAGPDVPERIPGRMLRPPHIPGMDAKVKLHCLEQDLLPVSALKSPIPNQALGT